MTISPGPETDATTGPKRWVAELTSPSTVVSAGMALVVSLVVTLLAAHLTSESEAKAGWNDYRGSVAALAEAKYTLNYCDKNSVTDDGDNYAAKRDAYNFEKGAAWSTGSNHELIKQVDDLAQRTNYNTYAADAKDGLLSEEDCQQYTSEEHAQADQMQSILGQSE